MFGAGKRMAGVFAAARRGAAAKSTLKAGREAMADIPRLPGFGGNMGSPLAGAGRARAAAAARATNKEVRDALLGPGRPKLKTDIPGPHPTGGAGWSRARQDARRREMFGVETSHHRARKDYKAATGRQDRIPPPPKTPSAFAQHGKDAAKWVRENKGKVAIGAGGLGVAMSVKNRTGRASDRTVGRPTGMYGY